MLKLKTAYFHGDMILRFEKINFLDFIIVGIKPAALRFIVRLHYIDLHFSSCGNSAVCSEKKAMEKERPLSLYNPIYNFTRQALGQLICRHWDYSWCLINLIAVVCVCVCVRLAPVRCSSSETMRQTRASSVCHWILTFAAAFVTHAARVSSFVTRSLASHMSYQV